MQNLSTIFCVGPDVIVGVWPSGWFHEHHHIFKLYQVFFLPLLELYFFLSVLTDVICLLLQIVLLYIDLSHFKL